jgi:tetratricopeptide (TPR) repeat protein
MKAVAALAGLALLVQASPAEEYKAKLEKLLKNTASKHYAVGDYLSTSQMHTWARSEFKRVLELDPEHEGARKRMGYKKSEEGKWEDDPSAKQDFGNKKKGEDAAKVQKSWNDRLDQAGKDLSRQWSDLALWCKKNTMEKESADAFRKALEYDPANATARKELGYEKMGKSGVWISKFERELRKEMKEGIAKAPQGSVLTAETETEKGLGIRMKKREGPHIVIESPHLSDPDMISLVQHCEHAYAMYHKIFGQEDLFGGRKMTHVILKDKSQHERYVDVFRKGGSAAEVELSKKSTGSMGFPRSEQYQDTRPIEGVQDMAVHSTVQMMSNLFAKGEHHWLHEGTSYHFTRLMKDSASTYCVDLAGTSPQNRGKNYQDSDDWPIVCKVWVRENKDPEILAILKCTNVQEMDGAETVKAWSLIEFLITEHREKFVALCKSIGSDVDVEKALKEIFDWSVEDLDRRWKSYVKSSY